MSRTVLQLRKGTSQQHSSFTGQLAEVTVDTTRKTLIVHDGVTVGGSALATLDSPVLIGTPTAPTATTGTNNTQLATTAFVARTLAAVGSGPVNTDGLPESGSPTNKYFTNARARAAISVSGSLSYNATSGVISYTTPTLVSAFTNDAGYLTNSNVRSQLSATGSLVYNTSTGVFSYTQSVDSVNGLTGAVVLTTINVTESGNLYYTDARTRAAISVSGPNITYSNGLITTTQPTLLSNTSNDSASLGTNTLSVTLNNILRAKFDATKFSVSRIQALDVNPGTNGNEMVITGGAGGTGSGDGGGLTLSGGSTADGAGGSVALTASDGAGSLRNAGSVSITSGTPGTGGAAGNITVTSKGATRILVGSAVTGTNFGSISLGSSETLPGSPVEGAVYIYSTRKSNTATTNGGLIDIRSSAGIVGGAFSVITGAGTAGNGGDIAITSGQGSGVSNRGGNINITAGTGVNSATTGTINLNSNVTISTSTRLTHSAAPTTDFHVTNRRYVRTTALAFSIALA
jgi:hypothetical protein